MLNEREKKVLESIQRAQPAGLSEADGLLWQRDKAIQVALMTADLLAEMARRTGTQIVLLPTEAELPALAQSKMGSC